MKYTMASFAKISTQENLCNRKLIPLMCLGELIFAILVQFTEINPYNISFLTEGRKVLKTLKNNFRLGNGHLLWSIWWGGAIKKLSKMCQKGELNYKKGWANKKISAPERRAIKKLLIWERNTRSPSHSK